MYNSKLAIFFFCSLLIPFSSFAEEKTRLGHITAQRAQYESLKLDVAIQEEMKKYNELLKPVPVPLASPNLIESLKVPAPDSTTQVSKSPENVENKKEEKKSRLISISGTENNLSAKVYAQNGDIVELKTGQRFEGGVVTLSRDEVLIKKGNLIKRLTFE